MFALLMYYVLASLLKMKKFCLFWEDGMSESIVDQDTPKIHKRLKFWCSKPKL